MFKPSAEHIEELLRARDICESILDEINCPWDVNQIALGIAAASIDNVLESFLGQIEALEC